MKYVFAERSGQSLFLEQNRPHEISQAKTTILALVVFIGMVLVTQGQSFSLYSSSNTPSIKTNEIGKDMVLQPIEMNNAPLSFAIGSLAKQAHVNIIIDGRLQEWWDMTGYFRWTDLTAKQALRRLLVEHDLVMVEDPQPPLPGLLSPTKSWYLWTPACLATIRR